MNTTKTSTNSTQGATPMRTNNTTHRLYLAVQDIAEMVNAYFETSDAPAPGKYQLIGVAGFTVGTTMFRVVTDREPSRLWVETFEEGLFVERTSFACPTDPTPPEALEAVAEHLLTVIAGAQAAQATKNRDLRVNHYREVAKQKPYVIAVRYAVAPTRRAQYIQSERRRCVNLTSRIDAARGFATEQEAQAWVDGIAPQLGGLLLSVANRREWAVAGLAKLGEDAEPRPVDSVSAMVEAFDRQPAHVVDRYLASLKDRA